MYEYTLKINDKFFVFFSYFVKNEKFGPLHYIFMIAQTSLFVDFVSYYCTFLKTSTVKCPKRFCIYLYSRNISTEGERKSKKNSGFFISKNFGFTKKSLQKKNLVLKPLQNHSLFSNASKKKLHVEMLN